MNAPAVSANMGSHSATIARTGRSCPDGTFGLGAWQHLAVSALSLLVVLSFALSWMGPMLDHHFAERHPAHRHIYLGAAVPAHSHDFSSFHSHSALLTLEMAAEATGAGTVEGVIFVSPGGGLARGTADLAVPALPPSLPLGIGDGAGMLGGHVAAVPNLSGAAVKPPTLPPRA